MSLKDWIVHTERKLQKAKEQNEQEKARKQREKLDRLRKKDTRMSRTMLATQRGDGLIETIKNELSRSRYERKK